MMASEAPRGGGEVKIGLSNSAEDDMPRRDYLTYLSTYLPTHHTSRDLPGPLRRAAFPAFWPFPRFRSWDLSSSVF